MQLDLSNNTLSGDFQHLVTNGLQYLDISNNLFSGNLSALAAAVGSLQEVILSNNANITGELAVTGALLSHAAAAMTPPLVHLVITSHDLVHCVQHRWLVVLWYAYANAWLVHAASR